MIDDKYSLTDTIGSVFVSKAEESYKMAIEDTEDKILAKINEKLKLASMGHFGVKHYIKYVNSYIVELNNGWVVEMELGGRVLHIYEDKTK